MGVLNLSAAIILHTAPILPLLDRTGQLPLSFLNDSD